MDISSDCKRCNSSVSVVSISSLADLLLLLLSSIWWSDDARTSLSRERSRSNKDRPVDVWLVPFALEGGGGGGAMAVEDAMVIMMMVMKF